MWKFAFMLPIKLVWNVYVTRVWQMRSKYVTNFTLWRIRANNSHVWKIRSVNIKVQHSFMKLHTWAQLIRMCVIGKNENSCSFISYSYLPMIIEINGKITKKLIEQEFSFLLMKSVHLWSFIKLSCKKLWKVSLTDFTVFTNWRHTGRLYPESRSRLTPSVQYQMSRDMTKPTKWLCAQRILKARLHIHGSDHGSLRFDESWWTVVIRDSTIVAPSTNPSGFVVVRDEPCWSGNDHGSFKLFKTSVAPLRFMWAWFKPYCNRDATVDIRSSTVGIRGDP